MTAWDKRNYELRVDGDAWYWSGRGERDHPYSPFRTSSHLRDGFPSLVPSFVRLNGDLLWGWEECSMKICLLSCHIPVVYFPLLDVKHTHMYKGDFTSVWGTLWLLCMWDSGLSDFMEQISSWESDRRFHGQVSPLRVHYCVGKCPPFGPILCGMNPCHIFISWDLF